MATRGNHPESCSNAKKVFIPERSWIGTLELSKCRLDNPNHSFYLALTSGGGSVYLPHLDPISL